MARPGRQRDSQSQERARGDEYRLAATDRPSGPQKKGGRTGGGKQPPRKKVRRRKATGWAWPSPCYTELPCPACDEPVFLAVLRDGRRLFLERQRRLVVFAGPYEALRVEVDETGAETVSLLPREPLSLWEEHTDRLVVGRAATEEERERYGKAAKGLNGVVPWTIGHESHLCHCPRIDRWTSGLADLRFSTLDGDRYGPLFYRLSLAQAEARLRATGKETRD